MLIEVKRNGFSFWEAPHRIGAAFDEPSPRQARGQKMVAAFYRNELLLEDANGIAADVITGDLNDPEEWGDLVQFADELDPEADVLAAEAETQWMIANIQKRVRAAFGVTWRGFMRRDRKKENWARTASMALCRQRIQGITMDQIGQAHGWKTHVAVVKALTRFETLRETSSKFAATLERVQAELMEKGGMNTRNMMN